MHSESPWSSGAGRKTKRRVDSSSRFRFERVFVVRGRARSSFPNVGVFFSPGGHQSEVPPAVGAVTFTPPAFPLGPVGRLVSFPTTFRHADPAADPPTEDDAMPGVHSACLACLGSHIAVWSRRAEVRGASVTYVGRRVLQPPPGSEGAMLQGRDVWNHLVCVKWHCPHLQVET